MMEGRARINRPRPARRTLEVDIQNETTATPNQLHLHHLERHDDGIAGLTFQPDLVSFRFTGIHVDS